jgi:hypothetical protein
MTSGLLALDDWLTQHAVSQVAMQSTGIYWRPVFIILEATRSVMVVNAQHIKAVPGRKTDVRDAEWIAELLRHGLLQPSFMPPCRCVSYAIRPATAKPWCRLGLRNSIGCRKRWKQPTSSWIWWSAMWLGSVAAA